jgi:hypothetical protein
VQLGERPVGNDGETADGDFRQLAGKLSLIHDQHGCRFGRQRAPGILSMILVHTRQSRSFRRHLSGRIDQENGVE